MAHVLSHSLVSGLIYIYIHMYIYIYMCTMILPSIPTTSAYRYRFILVYIYVCVHISIYIYIHMYIHASFSQGSLNSLGLGGTPDLGFRPALLSSGPGPYRPALGAGGCRLRQPTWSSGTAEARKLEPGRPPIPSPREKDNHKSSYIHLSNYLGPERCETQKYMNRDYFEPTVPGYFAAYSM